jgi:hypothetical protein
VGDACWSAAPRLDKFLKSVTPHYLHNLAECAVEFIGDAEVADPVSYGAGHPWSLCLEESSSLGSGGIFGRGSGGKSGSVATSSFRANARPKRPIAIKIAPPIISQCGNAIDESKRI